MREYKKKDLDELVRLLRKHERTGDIDLFRLAIHQARDMGPRDYEGYDLIHFVHSQINLARPTNADIYESLRFINAKVVE